MPKSLRDIAKVIDHSLLHPTLTDQDLTRGCEFARDNALAAVSIKPYAVPLAKEILAGSDVAVGTVVGFPHGNSHIGIKAREAEKACGDGATELDAVLNVGKVLSKDWKYISDEIKALNAVAVEHWALLKVIFENDYLAEDAYKIKLCELCNLHAVAFVKTSTGYGFVKQANGTYGYKGATDHDLELMRKTCVKSIQIKAAGGVRTLDDVLRVLNLGVARVGASATKEILEEAKRRGYK
ncbi:MAG: deoxyribose-phosphate aldolase [Candidatus Glassbacteria bacterium]